MEKVCHEVPLKLQYIPEQKSIQVMPGAEHGCGLHSGGGLIDCVTQSFILWSVHTSRSG